MVLAAEVVVETADVVLAFEVVDDAAELLDADEVGL